MRKNQEPVWGWRTCPPWTHRVFKKYQAVTEQHFNFLLLPYRVPTIPTESTVYHTSEIVCQHKFGAVTV